MIYLRPSDSFLLDNGLVSNEHVGGVQRQPGIDSQPARTGNVWVCEVTGWLCDYQAHLFCLTRYVIPTPVGRSAGQGLKK